MLVAEKPPALAQKAIRVQRMTDLQLIAQTMTHPRVLPHVFDDLSPPAAELRDALPAPDVAWYLGVFDGDEYLGLFFVHHLNGVLFEVHTCLLPSCWGPKAIAAAQELIAWVFENTQCRRLITNVPATNLLALRLARQAGLTQFGVNPRSILLGGVLIDQHMLGISKD